MAFDAGMLAEVISEIKNEALGAKTEKIQQFLLKNINKNSPLE